MQHKLSVEHASMKTELAKMNKASLIEDIMKLRTELEKFKGLGC
jgi:hypothetical protein